jgi:choline dehydrogenase-like flavoprotein
VVAEVIGLAPDNECDVVIVGSGAAGSMYASQLAAAGRSVVVLEAGPAWRTSDLVSSQIWARRLKWGGSPWDVQDVDGPGHSALSGRGFGGAALHHYGTWPRLHESDFGLASAFGRAADWPFQYEALRSFYDRVQEEFGISGDARAEVWRPPGAPYPLPPLPVFAQGQILAQGFASLGLRTASLPRAILSAPYKGRPACLHDGWCDAGCPIGALANPLVTSLADARRHGATLLSNCAVGRVLANARGYATGVEYHDAAGNRKTLSAQVVVLAAAPIQTARLMLVSPTPRSPDGLGNSSGKVGTGFMTHAAFAVYGLLPHMETLPHLGTPSGQLLCQDHYETNRHSPGSEDRFGAYQWQVGLSMKPNDFLGVAAARGELFGGPLTDFVREGTRHLVSMMALLEELPDEANRIALSSTRDPHGIPLPAIHHRFASRTHRLKQLVEAEGLAVVKAAGAETAWATRMAVGHLMGGAAMGIDPATSVTDEFGRCHDLANLIVAGASLFPTAGGVNPTYTINALSMRNAQHLISHWGQYSAQ